MSERDRAVDLAGGYAVSDSPDHINVISCALVAAEAELAAVRQQLDEARARAEEDVASALHYKACWQETLGAKDDAEAALKETRQALTDARLKCEFGCGPYPDDGSTVGGGGYGIVPACPLHGWVAVMLDERNSALAMIRDAWNAHMATCPQHAAMEIPSFDEIAEWMNAPSDTASAAAGDTDGTETPAEVELRLRREVAEGYAADDYAGGSAGGET